MGSHHLQSAVSATQRFSVVVGGVFISIFTVSEEPLVSRNMFEAKGEKFKTPESTRWHDFSAFEFYGSVSLVKT